jgi:hypothetical protein
MAKCVKKSQEMAILGGDKKYAFFFPSKTPKSIF